MKLSLRARTVLLFLGAAMLPAMSIGILATAQRVNYEKWMASRRVFRQASAMATHAEQLLLSAKSALELAASLDAVKNFESQSRIDPRHRGLPPGADPLKRDEIRHVRMMNDRRLFEYAFLLTRTGDVYLATPHEYQANLPHYNYAFRRYFQDALDVSRGRTAVSDVFLSTATNRPAVHVVTPVRSAEGKVLGVLGAAVRLGDILERADRANELNKAECIQTIIVDGCGSVVAGELATLPAGQEAAGPAELLVLAGHRGSRRIEMNGMEYLVGYHPIETGGAQWGVVVRQPVGRALAAARSQQHWFVALTVALSLLAAALGAVFATSITRPVKRLAAAAGQISRGELAAHVPIESDDELGDLTRSFNKMAEDTHRYRDRVVDRAHELERMNRQLRELDHLKSDFMANVSHELRTPLNAIIGFADLALKSKKAPLAPEIIHFLERVRANAGDLLAIVGRILQLTRVEAGTLGTSLSAFELGGLVEKCVAEVRDKAREKKIRLSVQIADGLPTFHTDASFLREILSNLLHNGVEFTDEGEVCIRAELEKNTFRSHGEEAVRQFAVITVSDTGIGIAPEDIPTIFEAFRQLDGSLSRVHGGLGLGLSISRRLTELLRGEISIESRLGEGSTFRIRIPVNLAQPR